MKITKISEHENLKFTKYKVPHLNWDQPHLNWDQIKGKFNKYPNMPKVKSSRQELCNISPSPWWISVSSLRNWVPNKWSQQFLKKCCSSASVKFTSLLAKPAMNGMVHRKVKWKKMMHLDIFRECKCIKKNMISQSMKKHMISQSSLFIYNDNLGMQNWCQKIDLTIVITQSS